MVECNKVNVRLLDSQLNKLKAAFKNQIGITLRMNIKLFNENNLLMNYYQQPRQATKLAKLAN